MRIFKNIDEKFEEEEFKIEKELNKEIENGDDMEL